MEYTLPENVENLTVNVANQVIFPDRIFTGNALNNSIKGIPDGSTTSMAALEPIR